jgi:hypothetical protein
MSVRLGIMAFMQVFRDKVFSNPLIPSLTQPQGISDTTYGSFFEAIRILVSDTACVSFLDTPVHARIPKLFYSRNEYLPNITNTTVEQQRPPQ